MGIEIRAVARDDQQAWDALYAAYAAFYKVAQTAQMRAQVWAWLHDAQHEVNGLVAVQDGVVIGLAHYRAFARPLAAGTGGFLDDLFVTPAARGSGAAEDLIAALKVIGQEQGWGIIRWITAEDNYRARGLYDRVAQKTGWATYDIKLD